MHLHLFLIQSRIKVRYQCSSFITWFQSKLQWHKSAAVLIWGQIDNAKHNTIPFNAELPLFSLVDGLARVWVPLSPVRTHGTLLKEYISVTTRMVYHFCFYNFLNSAYLFIFLYMCTTVRNRFRSRAAYLPDGL